MDGPLPWAGERCALGGMMPDRRRDERLGCDAARREDEDSSNSK